MTFLPDTDGAIEADVDERIPDERIPDWARWGRDPEADMSDEPWTLADWEGCQDRTAELDRLGLL